MFASVTGRRRGSDVRVVEILDDAAARIDGELRDDPLTEAELRSSLGAAYGWLGEYRKAEPQLRAALAILDAELENDDPRKLDVLDRLAIATAGTAGSGTTASGTPASGTPGAVEAARLLVRAVDIASREYGPSHDETLKAMVSLARHLYGPLGRLAEAETLLLDAWDRYVGRGGAPGAMETRILRRLAEATMRLDRVADAERIHHAVIESAALRRGVTHAALPAVERGDKLERSVFPSSAVAADVLTATLQEALDGYDDDPTVTGELMELFSVADGLFSLLLHRAQRLGAEGDYAVAEPLLRAELALLTRVNGADHDTVTLTRTDLANVLAALGRLDEAEALMRAAMEQLARQRGEDSADFANQRLGLAQIMRGQRRDAEAEGQVRQALATYERVMPPESWLVAEMRVNHGIALRNCGRYAEAEAQLLDGYQGLRATLGDDHGQVAWAREEVRWLYEEWGRPEEEAAWRAGRP